MSDRSFPGAPAPFVVALLAVGALLLACASRSQHKSIAIESGFIETNAGPLYYESRGSGDAIVLLHGGSLDRRIFDAQFEAFSAQYRVIRYDVRPFGMSGAARRSYSNVEDLRTILDSLRITRASLVGLSYGGLIALDFALTYPDRVDNLVLAGSGISGYQLPGEEEMAGRSRTAFQRGGLHEVVEEWLRDPYMRPAMERAQLAPRIRMIAHENDSTWLRSFRQIEPTPLEAPAIHRLEQVKPRTLILVGSRDIPALQQLADTLRVRIPGSELVTIPRAGHIVSMEEPFEFNRQVLRFLQQQRSKKSAKRQ